MKWIKASEQPPIVSPDFIKLDGSPVRGYFDELNNGEKGFFYPSSDGHGNPYCLTEDQFHRIEWLDESPDDKDKEISRLKNVIKENSSLSWHSSEQLAIAIYNSQTPNKND